MLSDAELLLGMSRHISTFAVNAATAQLDSLTFAGKLYEIAWRLRGSAVSSSTRVNAIAIEASIRPRELRNEVLPTLEALGWVEVERDGDRSITAVTETIPPAEELLRLAGTVLDICGLAPRERAALALLRATTRQPLTREAALEEAAGSVPGDDQAVEEALSALVGIHLVREVTDDSGHSVVFNPNVWIGDEEMTKAALHAEDAQVNAEVGALIEEVAAKPGMPEVQVSSTEPKWVDFAVAHGLVQRSVVQTTDGKEQRFLFTPHLTNDPFGGTRDASGHARQLVGSMVYAATFARYKLVRPAVFINALIRDGEAGDASPIGTDYPMLETAGIVRVKQGSRPDKFRFELLQADVAEEALGILNDRESDPGQAFEGHAGLRDQRSYVHIEKEQAKLASIADVDDNNRRRLISALRETTARRSFGGR